MKGMFFLILGIFFSLCSCHERQEEKLLLKVEKVRYGERERNVLDIYTNLSAGKDLMPVLVFVHGGGWCHADKQDIWNQEKGIFFLKNRVLPVAINYSLSPFPYELNNPSRIQHPQHIRDVALSIKWIWNNIHKYGGDKNQIFLAGHSAGSHLVTLLATNTNYLHETGLDNSVLKGVISLDAGAYLTHDSLLLFSPQNGVESTILQCYYNAFTDQLEVHKEATPYFNICKGIALPSFLLIYEDNIPYRKCPNEQFAAKVIANGGEAELYPIADLDHGGIYTSIGQTSVDRGISEKILDFIKQ